MENEFYVPGIVDLLDEYVLVCVLVQGGEEAGDCGLLKRYLTLHNGQLTSR